MQKKKLFFVSIFMVVVFFIGIFLGILINSKQPSFYRAIKEKIYYGYLNKKRVYHHTWKEIEVYSNSKLTDFYKQEEFNNLFPNLQLRHIIISKIAQNLFKRCFLKILF